MEYDDCNMTIRSWRNQFALKHGGEDGWAATIPDVDPSTGEPTGWRLFPDGAIGESSAHGACIDPPNDPVERWKRIVFYREAVTRRAEQAHHELHAQVKATFGTAKDRRHYIGLLYNGIEEDALTDLKASRGKVLLFRQLLASAREKLDKLTASTKVRKKALRAAQEEDERDTSRFLKKLQETRI
jgi:hypothetical protein